MNNIAHGGGLINGLKYTNSYESMLHHLQNGMRLFEIDVVRLVDSFGMAHNGKEEEVYNLVGREFNELTLDEFLNLRAYGEYAPIDFVKLNEMMEEYPDAEFILDIKLEGEDYADLLDHAISTLSLTKNIIPQVYCVEDIEACIERGFNSCIIGLWKNYRKKIFSEECYEFIEYVNNLDKINVFGYAVFYYHYYDDEFSTFKQRIKHQIYFHGQFQEPHVLTDDEIAKHNEEGYYFFI